MTVPVLDDDHAVVQRPIETRFSPDEVRAVSLETPPGLRLAFLATGELPIAGAR